MKRILSVSLVLLPVLIVFLHAQAKQTKQGYESATVVSVEKHMMPSDYVGTPTDAPPQQQSQDYSYDVGIRLSCDVYVGRYESAIDYLPAVFAPNHAVDVRLDKHVIYVSLPESDRVVKMGIISHKHLSEQTCPASA